MPDIEDDPRRETGGIKNFKFHYTGSQGIPGIKNASA